MDLTRRLLAGRDEALLGASFRRFMGVEDYPLDRLRADLARLALLLGHDDGEHPSGHDHGDQLPADRSPAGPATAGGGTPNV